MRAAMKTMNRKENSGGDGQANRNAQNCPRSLSSRYLFIAVVEIW